MADLTCEIVIDARPATIFPFLTDPLKHLEWLGTEAELDPRPGGTYRVRVGGEHPSAGEYRGGGTRRASRVHLRMG